MVTVVDLLSNVTRAPLHLAHNQSVEEAPLDGPVGTWAGVLSTSLLLVLCSATNGLLLASLCRGAGGVRTRPRVPVRNLDKLVGLIATVSLVNGCSLCLFQMVSFLVGNESQLLNKPTNETFCKVQGLTTNLMSLLIIWYKALLGFERYLKFVKPQEYDITFSKINLQIIVFGIAFVLLSAVSGPIYGWGNYAYMKDIHSCSFDLQAQNAVTYFVLSSLSYVVTPYIIMAYSCACILLSSACSGDRGRYSSSLPEFPSGPWNCPERPDVVLPLSLTVLASFSLQVPKYVAEIEQAVDPSLHPSARFLFAASWLQTFAINCCFASFLLVCHVGRRCLGCNVQCATFWRSRVASGLCDVDEENAVAGTLTENRWVSCPCWLFVKRPKMQKPVLLMSLTQK